MLLFPAETPEKLFFFFSSLRMAFAVFPLYLLSLWKRPFLYAGLLLQITYIVSRGLGLGRLPLVGPHDTLTFIAASIVAFSLPFRNIPRKNERFSSAAALTAAAFTIFGLISKQHNTPLPPVLKTLWFELHVVLAFLSYALFALAAIFGYLFLRGQEPSFEGFQYRTILVGYCLFSLSMIVGGVWAYLAWGTYWLWTPKELWTSILWLYYTAYLHARLRTWWNGKPAVILGMAGFGVVLFTYLGVSLLMKSSHTF
ncbi:MAG TPA: cytochrome c biogenesis protein CcsA [Thermodesulfovibrionales bacterium]|nr:cytochrome c biogenesis protein CcsA [Thermodesulfovibrionales bacterium]